MRKIAPFIVLLLGFMLATTEGTVAQKRPDPSRIQTGRVPILNGMARSMPRPEYPIDAERKCAGGRVEVEVRIDPNGEVVSAKAVSGNELLREVSETAATKIRFNMRRAVKLHGFLVYNFDPLMPKHCREGLPSERLPQIFP